MENQHLSKREYNSLTGCLIRLYWMIIGNALLFGCAVAISQGTTDLFGPIDALFWVLVGNLLIARYVDIRYFNGMTDSGEPATMVDFKRYASLLGLIAIGLWIGTHVYGEFYSGALPSTPE